MDEQMQSSVDRAVNAMVAEKQEPVAWLITATENTWIMRITADRRIAPPAQKPSNCWLVCKSSWRNKWQHENDPIVLIYCPIQADRKIF